MTGRSISIPRLAGERRFESTCRWRTRLSLRLRARGARLAHERKLLMNSRHRFRLRILAGPGVVAATGCRRNIVRAEPPSVSSPPPPETAPQPQAPCQSRPAPVPVQPSASVPHSANCHPNSARPRPPAEAEAPKPKAEQEPRRLRLRRNYLHGSWPKPTPHQQGYRGRGKKFADRHWQAVERLAKGFRG